MSTTLPTTAQAMLGIRSWFGTVGVLSPTPIGRLAGVPKKQMTAAAKMFAAVFGAREFLMVGLTLAAAEGSKQDLARFLKISAAVDAFDATAALLASASGKGSMGLGGPMTVAGGLANCALCLAAAQTIES